MNMVGIDETVKEVDFDDPLAKIFRHMVLDQEAVKQGSDILCPVYKTHLPKREPFFGWDNETGKPSYYCSVCDKYF